MTTPADPELLGWDTSGGQSKLTVRGDWTLDNYVALGEQIARLRTEAGDLTAAQYDASNIDLTGLGALYKMCDIIALRLIDAPLSDRPERLPLSCLPNGLNYRP